MTQELRPMLRIVGLLLLFLAGILTGAARADVITYFHNDISGSPVAATDESGRLLWKETYRPYGERLLNGAGPDANQLWFTGKPQDPDTGLSYLGARYYNPQLGRFMGIDPKAVDPGDPHSFNRYAYANNNPYKFVDPDGRGAVGLVLIGLALWVGTEMLPTPDVPAGSGEVIPTTIPDLGLLGATKGLVGVAAMTIRSVEKAAAKEGAEVAADIAKKVKVKDLDPLHSKEVVGDRPDLRKLSDDELLDSVTNPKNSDKIKVNTNTGKVVDGNSRAYELQRRAENPQSSITPDTQIPVENYTPDNSMFWDQ